MARVGKTRPVCEVVAKLNGRAGIDAETESGFNGNFSARGANRFRLLCAGIEFG